MRTNLLVVCFIFLSILISLMLLFRTKNDTHTQTLINKEINFERTIWNEVQVEDSITVSSKEEKEFVAKERPIELKPGLIIWPEDAVEGDDRIINQFKYRPPNVRGMKKILIWHADSSTWSNTFSITRLKHPKFGCPVHECEVTTDKMANETVDLIIFEVHYCRFQL